MQFLFGRKGRTAAIEVFFLIQSGFFLSLRDVEDLLAERGIEVSYESIRHWCARFGPEYAHKLKKRRGSLGDTWYLNEVFIKIGGELHYLWRAVDQDGD